MGRAGAVGARGGAGGGGSSLQVGHFGLQLQLLALQGRLEVLDFLQGALKLRPLHLQVAELVGQVAVAAPHLLDGALVLVEDVLQLHHAAGV